MSKNLNNTLKRGFTLIELLVVIAIIGILSSVVLASLSTARAKSRDARRIADIDQLRTALEVYFDTSSSYPTSTVGTVQNWDTTGLFSTGNQVQMVATTTSGLTPSIAKIPNPPSTGYKYYYYASSTTTYLLGADLERTDNSALKTDADITTATGFYGTSASCAVSGGTELCYDISN